MNEIEEQSVDRGRRRLLRGAAGAAVLSVGAVAAAAPANAKTAREIDAGVSGALDELYASRAGTRDLYNRAAGVLVIPDVVKAGFLLGGAYGEGALLVGGRTQSYWSYGAASFGLQLGVQRARQALFFMTPRALERFQLGDGFEVGVDAEVTLANRGGELAVDTTKDANPIIAFVYGREGLLGGASLQGGRYGRIRR